MDTDGSDDPRRIRSLAVTAEDVVDAFVYTRENPGTAVLRATPPFHGRMRARLHVYHVADDRLTGAVHVAPAALLADAVVGRYPTFADVSGRLDSAAEPATVREERAAALDSWRERALDALVDSVVLEHPEPGAPDGDRTDESRPDDRGHVVAIKRLGRSPD